MRTRSIVIPLLKWFSENSRDLPWRKTTDPYAIWVSEIMLQQTQVKTVIPYWERWMKRVPNISSLANANEDEVIKLWEGLGLKREEVIWVGRGLEREEVLREELC